VSVADFPRFLIGASTKMYFSHARTMEWCRAVADIARTHPAVGGGDAAIFAVPGYLSVPGALEVFDGAAMVGVQDLAAEDKGAFTGEVSGRQAAELGCVLAEVGHAERRRLFGEDDAVVRAKTAAALRAGLVPLLCLGEADRGDPAQAAEECIRQFDDALALAGASGLSGRVVVAYEPHWAIGAPEPAAPEHIAAVCSALREHLGSLPAHAGSAVIYGGSAGPGLLGRIAHAVDGLFLGRFAHDPAAVAAILDEVTDIAGHTPSRAGNAPVPADSIGAGGTDV
jgi:triosephosphate isomerase